MARKKIIHLHSVALDSVTKNGPKLPTADQIDLGELAVNYLDSYETISLKNNKSEIITFSSDEARDAKIQEASDEIKGIIKDNEKVVAAALNQVVESAGFDENGKYVAPTETGTEFIQDAATLSDADSKLAKAITTANTNVSNLTTRMTAAETNIGNALTKTDADAAYLPINGMAKSANKVANTLKITSGGTTVEYDGSESKTLEVSSGSVYSLPTATDSVLGGVKIGSGISIDTDGKISVSGQAYELPTATDSVLGGVKIGYTESDKNYAVQLDDNNKAYVNVPWTDTNTDTKVTAVGNHYTPSADVDQQLSVDAFASDSTDITGSSSAKNVVTGVNLQRDAKGHVTGVTVDSAKIYSSDNDTISAAYCTTDGSNGAKTASYTGYELRKYNVFPIIFTKSNTAKGNLTLSINGTTAQGIVLNGVTSSASNYTLPAGTYFCYYDGAVYHINTDDKLPKVSVASADSANKVANALTIKSGNTEITWDGSTSQEITVESGSYILPTATDSILGGVKIGNDIDITDDGTISLDGYPATVLSTSTDTSFDYTVNAESYINAFVNHGKSSKVSITFPLDDLKNGHTYRLVLINTLMSGDNAQPSITIKSSSTNNLYLLTDDSKTLNEFTLNSNTTKVFDVIKIEGNNACVFRSYAPSTAITASYAMETFLTKTKADDYLLKTDAQQTYMGINTVASANTLGGVKVADNTGITIDENGVISYGGYLTKTVNIDSASLSFDAKYLVNAFVQGQGASQHTVAINIALDDLRVGYNYKLLIVNYTTNYVTDITITGSTHNSLYLLDENGQNTKTISFNSPLTRVYDIIRVDGDSNICTLSESSTLTKTTADDTYLSQNAASNYLLKTEAATTYWNRDETVNEAQEAIKLKNTLTINGQKFDGSNTLTITTCGYCTTAADAPAKVVECPGFTLEEGNGFLFYFMYGNKYSRDFTFNVNDTGAKALVDLNNDDTITSYIPAGIYYCYYSNIGYRLIGYADMVSTLHPGRMPQLPTENQKSQFMRGDGGWGGMASSSEYGLVKTTSEITDTNGYVACPIVNGVPYSYMPKMTRHIPPISNYTFNADKDRISEFFLLTEITTDELTITIDPDCLAEGIPYEIRMFNYTTQTFTKKIFFQAKDKSTIYGNETITNVTAYKMVTCTFVKIVDSTTTYLTVKIEQ